MRDGGSQPVENALDIVKLLKVCTTHKDLHGGAKLHAYIREHTFLSNNCHIASTLINMYAKCGALAEAQQVLQELPVRDVITWNALIAGYAQQGKAGDALRCFDDMQFEGHSPDSVTFTCALKACGSIRAAAKGKEIHDKIVSLGMLEKDVVLGSTLVDMYARCGALIKAQWVLEELPVRDVVMWNALIGGSAIQGQGEEALKCFDSMQSEGHSPDAVTFICALKACGSIGAAAKGEQIHNNIVNLGMLKNNIILGNTLVDMYTRCGALAKAQQVLKGLPVRDAVTWKILLVAYVQQGQKEEALKCFDSMQLEGYSLDPITFVYALKACGSIGAVAKGEEIHDKIASLGILEKDIVLRSVLIDMYAKLGALAKAQQVLERFPLRDVVMWSILVGGYVQHGQGEEALKCFDNMLREGHSPDAVTFTFALKACGSTGRVAKGEEIHQRILHLGLLEKDCVLGNTLVDMYVRCGAIAKAVKVLQELPVRDVVTWSPVIAGYAQQGQGEEALRCFDNMQRDGHSPDAVSFMSALKACGVIGTVSKGEQIHYMIARLGMPENNIVLMNTLVDMYAKCGALAKAQQVVEGLHVRSVVTWSVLITGYSQNWQGEKAMYCFDCMQHEGHSPNVVTFSCALKACGSMGALVKGEQIHNRIISLGMLEGNVVIGNALIGMYTACGALAKAEKVLEGLPVRDMVTWSTLIAGYHEQGQWEEALKWFDNMQHEGTFPDVATYTCVLKACGNIGAVVKGEQIHNRIANLNMQDKNIIIGNTLIDMYAKCGALAKALEVLEGLPVRNVVTWNALIAGYAQNGQGDKALDCLDDMQNEGHSPDVVTFTYALKACRNMGIAAKGEEIHDKVVCLGMLEKDIILGNSLVHMYARCGAVAKAQQLLDGLHGRDMVTWNSLISGYVQHGLGAEALNFFDSMQDDGHSPDVIAFTCALKACGSIGAAAKGKQLHDKIANLGMLEKDVLLGTTLVDMYVKCGAPAKAQQVHERLPVRDVVTWNTLIAGYAQQGQGEDALKCYDSMQIDGHSPDVVTFICALKACGIIGASMKGEQIHDKIVCLGLLEKNIELGNALIDMHVKCAALVKALEVFKEHPHQNQVGWNALIGGYAQQGLNLEAMNCFEKMQSKGLQPDPITLVSVLNACSHSGMLDQAEMLFWRMSSMYGITPNLEHLCCMVDLFGRASKFNKALVVIEKMPCAEYPPVWTTLLGACHRYGEVKLGRLAFKRALALDNSNAAVYVCMSNMCTAAGMQEMHTRLREK